MMARKPSHFGSKRLFPSGGMASASFASIGSMGGEMGKGDGPGGLVIWRNELPASPGLAMRPAQYYRLVSHNPSMAPVGSTMILSDPMFSTGITSFMIFAPSDLAFFVAAWMSWTST